MIIGQNMKNNQQGNNEANLEVMSYLVQKLEARQKKLFKFKSIFNQLDSFESFYSQRKDIFLFLNDIEEDLKQATFAIKALVLQNKTLLKEMNNKIKENYENANKLNLILGENENLKLQINSMKDNEINYQNNSNIMNVNIDSIKVDDEGEYEEPKLKCLDFNDNNNYSFKIYNRQDKFSNIGNIMNEIRDNKKNLQKMIEQHLKTNDIE